MTHIDKLNHFTSGPNFIYLGGQKYGYRPVPAVVDSAELKLLRETLVAMGTDVTLLDRSTRISMELKLDNLFCHVLDIQWKKIDFFPGGTRLTQTRFRPSHVTYNYKYLYNNDKNDNDNRGGAKKGEKST